MKRQLRMAVDETLYWGVQAQAAEGHCSIPEIFGELAGEGLAARALQGDSPTMPPMDDITLQIVQIAAIDEISVSEAWLMVLGMGLKLWQEDARERANP